MYFVETQKKYAKLHKEAVEKLANLYGIEATDKPAKEEVPDEASSTRR